MARRELLLPPPLALDTAPMTGEAAAAAAAAAPALAAATATGCFFKPGATTAVAAAGVLLLGVEGFLAGGVPATGNSSAGTRGGGVTGKVPNVQTNVYTHRKLGVHTAEGHDIILQRPSSESDQHRGLSAIFT